MRTTEDILLNLRMAGPKPYLELLDHEGGCCIDQSMDVTVRGTIPHARKLLELFLVRPTINGEGFDFKVHWHGSRDDFKVFTGLLRDVGGLEHFDKIKDR